jgi:AraC-like DNA-binding protein
MALAKEALRAGASSVGDIAMSIGFQSASAFSTAFTKAVGCSPTRFHTREIARQV